MKRGEIWTASGGAGYAGKPRPVVIVQDERFDQTSSITICPFTTAGAGMELFRVPIEPSEHNGLNSHSMLMADKLMTVPRSKLGRRLGVLDRGDITRLDRAMLVFLGFAG